MEKEPLPQLVEVLFHAAARAVTFLVLVAVWLYAAYSCGVPPSTLNFQSYAVAWTASKRNF